MRRLEIQTQNGRVVVYATNDNDGGLFSRYLHEGAYHQFAGTCQTPVFKSKKQFRTYLRQHYDVRGRTIAAYGWGE
jgi:hypothetical protein